MIPAPQRSIEDRVPRDPGIDPGVLRRIIPLIDRIYQAATQPDRWNEFVAELSRALDGAAIVMNMEIPNRREPAASYRIHSEERYAGVFAELAIRGEVPWPLVQMAATERFVRSDEFLTSAELRSTELYRGYMQPQGFATEGQAGHVLAAADGRPLAAIGIYCHEGGHLTTDADLSMLDQLVPHLRNAYAIHCELREAHYRQAVSLEAIDRFPIGVLFIDRDLQVVESNRAADRIAEQADGFSIANGVPQATGSVSYAGFSRLLGRSVIAGTEVVESNILSIQRPSGRQPYEALVAGLLSSLTVTQASQSVAVVFIADPEDQHLRMPHLLASLYGLTRAESDLASLLASGHSVEEAANARNVTENTVRSQLKKVFTKTGVSRQTDLVRLLAASVATLETPSEDES